MPKSDKAKKSPRSTRMQPNKRRARLSATNSSGLDGSSQSTNSDGTTSARELELNSLPTVSVIIVFSKMTQEFCYSGTDYRFPSEY